MAPGEQSLLRLVDCAVTSEGSRRLLAWLSATEPYAETGERQSIVKELAPRHRLRMKVAVSATLKRGARGWSLAQMREALKPGLTCHDVHQAVSAGFLDRGYHLGHVTGHSIGMTMIEFPKIGEGVDTELEEGMVFSMHPHAIAQNGEDCLYMQETWLVTADGGEPLSTLPMQVFRA